jgi:hypothetical protein
MEMAEGDDWQCHYISGRCSYVCCTNQAEKHVPYEELFGTIDSIML